MTSSLDAALLVLFLIVGAWTAIFGSAGVVLAPAAGVARTLGLVIGALLGPIGIGWLMCRGRRALGSIDDDSGSPPPITDQFPL